ncbi:MAG: hypothetical protein DYH02_07145 [Candidatus Omnitrophica bacterium COP1]|nr:hypothetical protein [Candidatus Omnitrophica bacterium COP1]
MVHFSEKGLYLSPDSWSNPFMNDLLQTIDKSQQFSSTPGCTRKRSSILSGFQHPGGFCCFSTNSSECLLWCKLFNIKTGLQEERTS